MIKSLFKTRRAVTLTELLVVLAIISLLATIAVPVYIQQLQRAKVAVAQVEVREIAEAMQHVAITHGFLVPIHVLNNIPNTSGTTAAALGTPAANRDDFNNLTLNDNFIIDVTRPLVDQRGSAQLRLDSDNARVRRMITNWQGPFLNPKRIRYGGENVNNPTAFVRLWEDFVVDPWGNPYRVYSPFGVTGSDQTTPANAGFVINRGMVDLAMTTGARDAGRFDRFAIVSYGPDGDTGYFGNPAFQGDDIYYKFSVGILNESFFDVF